MKKLSELMLEGYAMAGYRQCKGALWRGVDSRHPEAVCGIGAIVLAATGDARGECEDETYQDLIRFKERVGVGVMSLNDGGMSIPDIAGIAAAEGL